jgi:hypothetical protein
MEVLLVQRVDHGLRVGVILVPGHLAHGDPPEPVLHDVVDGDVLGAVFGGDAFDLDFCDWYLFLHCQKP